MPRRQRWLLWPAKAALAAAFVLLAFGPLPGSGTDAAGPAVAVDPATSSIVVGETTDVSIRISDVTNLYSASFHLTFDPAVLEVVDANLSRDGVQVYAGTFPGPSEGPGEIVTNAADNAAGTVDYDFTLIQPAPPASGSGVLAVIRFQAKATGTSALSITSALLWDPQNEPIAAETSGGSVEVAAAPTSTATPAPPTPTPTGAATATRTSTPQPTATGTVTPQPTGTATPKPTGTATSTPSPAPQSSVATPTPTPEAAVVAAAANATAQNLPSAGTAGSPSQLWRWFFLFGALILGLSTWAFTFRFYAQQKESERFWHR
ncbi:MAG: cohesin domain-containing protein [Dehalococcoidia bacterium]|nr:cohesin domain-containing protein [Dehalococcoidia bacterium]